MSSLGRAEELEADLKQWSLTHSRVEWAECRTACRKICSDSGMSNGLLYLYLRYVVNKRVTC